MSLDTKPILDYAGRIMFRCGSCGQPISHGDIFELGLRVPEHGETADDYAEAELIDRIDHPSCSSRERTA